MIERARKLVRRVSPWTWGLVGIAVALRVLVSVAYRPAVFTVGDTGAYLTAASQDLYSDPLHTFGYPLFLRALHAISAEITFTIAVQHLLGIAAGVILYATVRRIGAPFWVAALAAAPILLSLDQIVLEHTPMAEALFTFGLVLVLYASVHALETPHGLAGRMTTRHAWIAVAGLALGLATWVRAVGLPMVPFLALWFVLAIPGSAWTRIGRGALAGGTAVSVVLVYMWLNSMASGHFVVTYAPGWTLYSRTAPFADCARMDPPKGTEELCEEIPAGQRPGPEFYAFDSESPARQIFDHPARGDHKLRAFGREAVLSQPLDYALHAGRDFGRYFVPALDYERPYSGDGYDALDMKTRIAATEQYNLALAGAWYEGAGLTVGEVVPRLSDIQFFTRFHPLLMLAAAGLGAAGLWHASGRRAAVTILFLGAALLLLAIPSATTTYSARYAIPAGGALAAAGAIGLWTILEARGTRLS